MIVGVGCLLWRFVRDAMCIGRAGREPIGVCAYGVFEIW
jgi:hypothetical protein